MVSKVRTHKRFSFRVRMKRSAQPFPSGARTKAGELALFLILKGVGHVLRSVIVPDGEAAGDVLGEGAETVAHALADRFERLEASGARCGMDADAFGGAVVHSHEHRRLAFAGDRRGQVGAPSVDAPLRARENFRIAVRVVGCCHLPASDAAASCRRPVWEFADRFQITCGVLDARWGTLVFPIPSRRLLRHTLLPIALRLSRSQPATLAG